AAANDVENILRRRGDGPAYGEVLRRAGLHMGLELPVDDVGLAEHALALEHTRQRWHLLPDHERDARWQEALGDPPTPEEGEMALSLLEHKHRRKLGYHVIKLVNEPPGPMPGCLFLAWLARPRFELVMPALMEVARLRQSVRHRVTVGVVGSPSSGKDAAIAALFGIETHNISPVAGSTKSVEITKLAGPTALYVVNTPGMGDVIESVTEEARQVLDHIDVYLYVINAQGGVQAREKADHEACLRTGRPVLAVVNKIDTLREEDRERYLEDARHKLQVRREDFLAAAFDPLPQLSESPIGIEAVQQWVTDRLVELGKDPTELPWMASVEEQESLER
ncbi:MAG TPA: hypothetical protein ENK18_08360, partial [Deltaproteobacteria bacterium]|nr:hypothetical protein [Deltaproteobacteria bacterium]